MTIFIYLFIYLFVCGLFDGGVSISDYIEQNGGRIMSDEL